MLDHLVHGYDAVDLDEVWHTTVRDVPGIVRFIQDISSPTTDSES